MPRRHGERAILGDHELLEARDLKIDGPLRQDPSRPPMGNEDDDRDDRLDECDQANHETAGDLADPLLAFIAANRDQIGLT